jgi:serine protease inhibitor ecotin
MDKIKDKLKVPLAQGGLEEPAKLKENVLKVESLTNGFIPATGSKSDDFSLAIIKQVVNSLWLAHADEQGKDKLINYSVDCLKGIKPQDEIEGMLAVQMIACHNAAMECFRRAMIQEQTIEGRGMNLGQANKLTRSYSTLMEALNKYRGKGQQKVTVEHVHVHNGGQAIVGSVEGK